MEYFVFKTEKYDEELNRHGEKRAFENFRSQREDEHIPHPIGDELRNFPGNYVKKYHDNLRSIFTFKDLTIEGTDVRIYVALRLIPRGSEGGEYASRFLHDKKRDIYTGLSSLNWSKYEDKVAEIIREKNKPVVKPYLSECERRFISEHKAFIYKSLDIYIFESKEWYDKVKAANDFYLSCLRVAINEILNESYERVDGIIHRKPIPHQEQEILYSHSDEYEWHLLNIVPVNQEITIDLEQTDILRGYPFCFLEEINFPIWLNIEKDKDTNFILSQEEKEIVTQERKEYPLFISGRAGSGKSTVLQYMFAEIIVRYFKTENNESLFPPIYLSYSDRLIDRAKEITEALFKTDNVFIKEIAERELDFKADIQPHLSGFYKVFGKVVQDCVKGRNPELYARKFDEGKYVSFSKFEKLWRAHFKDSKEARTKYDPTVSWHVIRTYIKGWQSDKLLGRDDYEIVVPKSDRIRSVKEETYRLVYDEVWTKWYSKKDYWDEQDLVRECLCPSDGSDPYVSPQFSAIFCDEAQDFTRIEVDFILRSSCFSNRSIQTIDDLKQLPFVFAGDEFQTLNPTGFSWDMLRAHFVEALFSAVGLGSEKDRSSLPEPKPLSFNYRSTAEIVKFSNNIQLLRASRFHNQSKPQAVHSKKEQRAVFRLSPKQLHYWKLLAENEIDLIVPAVEGQTPEEFVRKTKEGEVILKSGITIFDTVQAKGLEYENVAVYGFDSFGKNNALELNELIKWFNKDHIIKEDDLDLKYQMSNTYVAVTRAKNKLFIMSDSEEPSFWNFADQSIEQEKVSQLTDLMLKSVEGEWSSSNIGFIEPGDESDITSENLGNWQETAHQRERNAEYASDEDMMKKASVLYRNHGENKDADRCAGKAAKIRGDYNEAVSFFEKSEEYDLALYSLWTIFRETKDPTLIARIALLSNKVQDSYARDITKVCSVVDHDSISVKDYCAQLAGIKLCLDVQKSHLTSLVPWQAIIDMMSKKIDLNNINVSDFERISESKKQLLALGLKISDALLANMAYSIQHYEKAVELWNYSRLSSFPPEYYKSNIEISSYPDNLRFFEKAGFKSWQAEVINSFESHGSKLNDELDPVVADIICKALFESEQKAKYIEYLPQMLACAVSAKDKERFVLYYEKAKSQGLSANEDAVIALIALCFDELDSWKRPIVQYKDKNAAVWFSAIEKIRVIRNLSDEAFKNDFRRSTSFWVEHCTLGNNEVIQSILHFEMGQRMERRGIHVDAAIFYEWAKKQYSSKQLRNSQDIRWVACKRKQAGRDGIESSYWKQASDRLEELGMDPDYEISDFPFMSFEQWTELIQTILYIKPDIKTPEDIEKESIAENNTDGFLEVVANKDNQPASINTELPVIEIDGYQLILRPKKNDIRIEFVEDLVSINIGNGKIPMSTEDFFIKNSQLYRRDGDSEVPTPFIIQVKNDRIHIIIKQH